MEIQDKYSAYIPVFTDGLRMGLLWLVLVFSPDIVSMKLPDSASILIAEIWAIIQVQGVVPQSDLRS